jgi:hypothetical protein
MPERISACEETRFDRASRCDVANSRRNTRNGHGFLPLCIQLAHSLPPLEHRPRRYTSRYLYVRKDASFYLENVRTSRHVGFCPSQHVVHTFPRSENMIESSVSRRYATSLSATTGPRGSPFASDSKDRRRRRRVACGFGEFGENRDFTDRKRNARAERRVASLLDAAGRVFVLA